MNAEKTWWSSMLLNSTPCLKNSEAVIVLIVFYIFLTILCLDVLIKLFFWKNVILCIEILSSAKRMFFVCLRVRKTSGDILLWNVHPVFTQWINTPACPNFPLSSLSYPIVHFISLRANICNLDFGLFHFAWRTVGASLASCSFIFVSFFLFSCKIGYLWFSFRLNYQ